MTDPIVRFVSAPSVDATTRFDFHLNDGDGQRSWSDRTTFSWLPGALLGEPDGIGGDNGLGRLDLTFYVGRSRADALGVMGALARELQRDENYVLFQLDAGSPPMWLKTFRASPGALTFPYVDSDFPENDVWLVDVSLPTEARALSERESFTVTIANDPAADNGLAVTLPDIKGDAPAPLVVEMPVGVFEHTYPLVSVAAYDIDWPGVQFWEAEAFSNYTDASDVVDATASGGSVVEIDFGTDEALALCLRNGITPVLAGRWMLFGRFDQVGSGDVTTQGRGDAASRQTRTTISAGRCALVELGEYGFPRGNLPTSRPYVLAASATDVELYASRDSGTSTLRADYVVALPMDGVDMVAPARTLAMVSDDGMAVAGVRRFDGEREVYERIGGDGTHLPVDPVSLRGSFPQVVPGATNVLHLLLTAYAGSGANDDITDTTTLTVSYQPRHSYLPGD